MESVKKTSQRSAQEIEELKQSWKQSGKSKKAFSREKGINYMTFIGWFSRKEKPLKESSGFVALEVKQPATNSAGIFAEIDLGKGRRIVFHQRVGAAYFQQLLK